MCWRDDVPMTRYCSLCKQEYFGDFGHRNCPKMDTRSDEEMEQTLVETVNANILETIAWINGMGKEELLRTHWAIFKKWDGSTESARQALIAHFEEGAQLARTAGLIKL